jgi:dipeptidyl aminopeptidase/acylaminoacyl peptidase
MIFYILFFFIFFILFLSLWGFWQATHPPKITSSLTPENFGWQFEKASLKTEDGLKLAAWFIPTKKQTNKAIILLHGYPADKGDLLYWAAFIKEDYNLLFFDFRYFGASEGSFTSLGHHERKDILAAIEYLKKKGINKIGLMGFSFGASTALLTLPQTSDVDTVVADSAWANLNLMGEGYYGNIPFLQKPLIAVTKLWGRFIYGIDAAEIAPEAAARKVQTPILLIASRQDETVPIENAERLKKTLKGNPNAQFWFIDKGIHGGRSAEIQNQYETKVLKFFNESLK